MQHNKIAQKRIGKKYGAQYYGDIALWRESLNSDGHQFHLYQQNEQSPTYDVGNPDPGTG